ncbi:MAG: sorbosone dehydrogenase family protein [Sandaracinaceae bacterium]
MRLPPLALGLALLACSDPAPAPRPDPAPAPEPELPDLAQEEPLAPTDVDTRLVDLDTLAPPARREPSPPLSVIERPSGARLAAPDGFRVQRVAEGLANADSLALDRRGTLHVIDRAGSRIVRLEDADRDGVAETRSVFADADDGLDHPGAMVFTPGAAFIAQRGAVMRHALPEGQTALEGTGGQVASFPDSPTAWGPSLVLAPDRQHLYVGIGAGARVRRPPPLAASVLEINFSGSQRRTVATGLHQAVLGFHGPSHALVAVVAERPDVSAAPDLVTRVTEGAHYGWPTHVAGRPDPRSAGGETPAASDALLAPGSAPRALAWGGPGWPEPYRNAALVALAGSDARPPAVIAIQMRPDGTPQEALPLLSGFTTEAGAWGRPSGLAVHPDGSLYVSDGPGGHVFRVLPPR